MQSLPTVKLNIGKVGTKLFAKSVPFKPPTASVVAKTTPPIGLKAYNNRNAQVKTIK